MGISSFSLKDFVQTLRASVMRPHESVDISGITVTHIVPILYHISASARFSSVMSRGSSSFVPIVPLLLF